MGRNIKAWRALILFLIAFLAGSGITEGARDLRMTGSEVYHPQSFLRGILGCPFKGWGGELCCGGSGIPGWVWGLHKAELAGLKDEAEGGAGNGKFASYYGGALGQTP